jgi:hypothetical protein
VVLEDEDDCLMKLRCVERWKWGRSGRGGVVEVSAIAMLRWRQRPGPPIPCFRLAQNDPAMPLWAHVAKVVDEEILTCTSGLGIL